MAENEGIFVIDASQLTTVGYGLDMGGSLSKVAYVTKVKDQPNKRRVHIQSFRNDKLEDLLHFLQESCDLDPTEAALTVTGFGSLINKQKLEDTLKTKLNLVMEFPCFAKTLVWCVNNLPVQELCYPKTERSLMEAAQALMSWAKVGIELGVSMEESQTPGKDPAATPPAGPPGGEKQISYYVSDLEKSCDHFPCLMVMIGSAVAFSVVTENKQVQLLEAVLCGGRSLTALSKLLLGAKDFEEMMQLAMKGDICGVDVCGIHMKKDAPDDPAARLYTSYPDRETAYHLGLATESDGPFKKEDIAASIVRNFSLQIVMTAHLLTKVHKLRRIFFLGSVPTHPYMRYSLERYMLERLHMMEATNNDIKFGFLRHGGSYGAIGTLLL